MPNTGKERVETQNLKQSFTVPAISGAAVSGAISIDGFRLKITSEALTTAAAATYTLTVTNPRIQASSTILGSVKYGTSTQGEPVVGLITPADGSAVIEIANRAAADALDGTIVIDLVVIGPQ